MSEPVVVAETPINPNYYRYTALDADNNKHTYIYHTSAAALLLGQSTGGAVERIDKEEHVTVYALDVEISEPLCVPARNVTIVCRKLTIDADDNTQPIHGVWIDTSAPALDLSYQRAYPTNGDKTQQPAGDGKSGDTIAAEMKQLNKKGATDYGSKGVAAGNISIYCDVLTLNGRAMLRADGGQGYAGCDGQDTSNGRGGAAGKGGDGGNAGAISVRAGSIVNPQRLIVRAVPGSPGANGRPGQGSLIGREGTGASPGSSGNSADALIYPGITRQEIGAQFDAALLRRLLHHAKLIYLFNEPRSFRGMQLPECWSDLTALVAWLVDLLTPYIAAAKTDDPQKETLRQLGNQAFTMQQRIDQQKTYFGWRADWIPSLPLQQMYDLFRRSFDIRQALEANYLKICAQMQDKAAAQAALDDARKQATGAATLHRARAQALLEELTVNLPKQIAASMDKCDRTRDALSTALKEYKSEVQSCFSCPSADDLLHAAEMIAFTQGEESAETMGALEIGNLIYTGWTTLPGKDGQKIQKVDYLQNIVALKGDIVASAKQAVLEKDANGQPKLTDKQLALLTSLEAFRKKVDDLSNALPKAAVAGVTAAINDFEGALSERSEALLASTMFATRYLEEILAANEAEARSQQKDAAPDPLTPAWVEQVSYYTSLYQSALEKNLEGLSMFRRKLAYMTLDDPVQADPLTDPDATAIGNPPPDLTALAGQFDDLHTQLKEWGSNQISPLLPIPEDLGLRGELLVSVTAPELIQKLQSERRLQITTVRDRSRQPNQVVFGNDQAYYDIRVTEVHPLVIGAKTNSGMLRIGVSSSMQMQIVNQSDQMVTFWQHYARETNFTHSTAVQVAAGPADAESGKGARGRLIDDDLDVVGLYGTWTFTLSLPDDAHPNDDNAGLDLTGVTQVLIYFSVLARSHAH